LPNEQRTNCQRHLHQLQLEEALPAHCAESTRVEPNVVALQDAEVCSLPLDRIAQRSPLVKKLQHHIHKIMGREIVLAQQAMLMLGSMRAN